MTHPFPIFSQSDYLIQVVNPPLRSGWGIIEMAFLCPSVSPSVRPSICPSITLSCPLHIFERFPLNFGQMFASVSRCAEPISQSCQLKVKVTGQGDGFEPWISCPLHISYTPGRIFFKLWSYVCRSETMCRTHNSTMLKQGQGHSSRSQVWALNFVSLNFGQMFTCGTMCRTHNSAMETQGQGHSSRSRVWALNFVSTRYLLYPWKDFLLILVKCLPQWNDVQNP